MGLSRVTRRRMKKMAGAAKRSGRWYLCRSVIRFDGGITGSWPTGKIAMYSANDRPPIPNEKKRLSISNPVVWARLKSEGGFQYAGTKSGSVSPRNMVQKLTMSISCFISSLFRSERTIAQMTTSRMLQSSHSRCGNGKDKDLRHWLAGLRYRLQNR